MSVSGGAAGGARFSIDLSLAHPSSFYHAEIDRRTHDCRELPLYTERAESCCAAHLSSMALLEMQAALMTDHGLYCESYL